MFAFLNQPNIDPVILPIYGVLAIRWYSLMYIVAFAFIYFFSWRRIKKGMIKMTEAELSDYVFAGFLGAVIGARIGYELFYDFFNLIQNPVRLFAVWEGGMSFHGGFLGCIVGTWIYTFIKKINFFDISDIFVIPVAVGLGLGRWGNFVNGELWGRPTDAPWGMIFRTVPEGRWFPISQDWVRQMVDKIQLPVVQGQVLVNLPRHPSQLYEMLLEGVLLFLVLWLLSRLKNKLPRGIIISTFVMGYGICRFFIEFFREPDIQIGYLAGGWFTMGMLLSTPMILAGLFGLLYFFRKNERNKLWA